MLKKTLLIIFSFILLSSVLPKQSSALDLLGLAIGALPIDKMLGKEKENIKIWENGDTWTIVDFDGNSKLTTSNTFFVTNNTLKTPDQFEVKELVRQQTPYDEDGKALKEKTYSIYYLQKKDGTIIFYGDNYTENKDIRWYDTPQTFLPGTLKKNKKWSLKDLNKNTVTITIMSKEKITLGEIKISTWKAKVETADKKEKIISTTYRWYSPQIAFYVKSSASDKADSQAQSLIEDIQIN